MITTKDFAVGDLVWAKMKSYPFWPGRIAEPPSNSKSTAKKAHHYVFFFGSENYAWIPDENIVCHSEEMMESFSNKKKSTLLKIAIDRICDEALKDPNSLVKAKESLEGSSNSTEKKNEEGQKTKTESPEVQKKITPQKRALDDSADGSPPQKSSKPTEDFSELIDSTSPNGNCNRVAVIKPLDEQTNSCITSELARREYHELQPGPSFSATEHNEAISSKNISPTDKKIGFIGLGMIGQRLVKNLLSSDHDVTIWNRTPEKCTDFAKIGASLALTPSDVVEKCDLIFCCVSTPEASKSLVFGNCGILLGLEKSPPGSKGYIEMSTIDAATSIEIAEAITHKGGRYLEAPVNGSRQMAEDGALLILGAGDRELFAQCESCFFAMSKNAYYLSCDVGSGSKMNLVLSMLMGITHAALAEAMCLVERCNLSLPNFLEILELGQLGSPLVLEKGHAMRSRCFTTNNSLKYQQKDLNLAISLGNTHEQPLLTAAAANELYKHAKLLRYSDHDVSAVFLGAKY